MANSLIKSTNWRAFDPNMFKTYSVADNIPTKGMFPSSWGDMFKQGVGGTAKLGGKAFGTLADVATGPIGVGLMAMEPTMMGNAELSPDQVLRSDVPMYPTATGARTLTPSGMPKFSDVPSIVNPVQQEVGTGTVLMQNQGNAQTLPVDPYSGFNFAGQTSAAPSGWTPYAGNPALQKSPATSPQVQASPANKPTPDFNSLFTGTNNIDGTQTIQDAQGNWVNAVDPSQNVQSTSWMDSLNNMFGLEGTDRMSAGDLAGGVGSLVTGGLGAYGMFETLNQGQEQIDQGWANYNLKKDAFDEDMRHRKAVVAQNKRA